MEGGGGGGKGCGQASGGGGIGVIFEPSPAVNDGCIAMFVVADTSRFPPRYFSVDKLEPVMSRSSVRPSSYGPKDLDGKCGDLLLL